jgi:uncharacterized protein YjbJ (UPF0337 family)
MNEDELKGKADQFKGRVKEATGVMTGDTEKRGEGLAQQVKGAVREKLGELKRAVERRRDRHDHE